MNDSKSVLLVIGSGLKLYREYLIRSASDRAHAAGLDLVLINNLRPTWQHEYFDEIHVVNVFDHGRLRAAAREVAAKRTIAGLICYDEPLVMPAAELAAGFGVPGLSVPGVLGCRDKHSARSRLTAAGVLQPGFEMTESPEQARAAARRIGYPVVVKPRALGASMGVVLAADEAQLDAAYRAAHAASLVGDEEYRGGAIVERYATGPEISVDAAVHKGDYMPMFLARKRVGEPPYFEELGHVVDADDPLLRDRELIDTLARAHRVLEIEDGITHAEVRLTGDGSLIIEINGRLGGDLIPFPGRTATGIAPARCSSTSPPGTVPTSRSRRAGSRASGSAIPSTTASCTTSGWAPGLVTASRMVDPGTMLHLPPGGYIARHSFVVVEAGDRVPADRGPADDTVRLDEWW